MGGLLGFLVGLPWLLLPVTAVVSIRRRHRNRPGSSCWFAYTVIVGWVLGEFALIALQGLFYGENGSSPGLLALLEALLIFGALLLLHTALLAAGAPRADEDAP